MAKKKHRKKHKRSFIKPVDKKRVATKAQTPAPPKPAAIRPEIKPAPLVQPKPITPKIISSRPTTPKSVAPRTWGERIENYLLLMRVDRPIGILLLLWSTYWA